MPSPLIDTRQLRYVAMLVKHRNFRRAADALFITQPALTKSIRNLEDLLGVPLFDRQPNDVNPTAYCDVFMEHATQVFVELGEIHHKLDLMSNLQRGKLKLGSGPIVAQAIVSEAVSRLVCENPELNIQITIDSWHELTRLLRQGDIHLFIADVEDLMDQPDLLIEKLPSGKSTFACRPGHPLATAGMLSPEDLLSTHWLFPHFLSDMSAGSWRVRRRVSTRKSITTRFAASPAKIMRSCALSPARPITLPVDQKCFSRRIWTMGY